MCLYTQVYICIGIYIHVYMHIYLYVLIYFIFNIFRDFFQCQVVTYWESCDGSLTDIKHLNILLAEHLFNCLFMEIVHIRMISMYSIHNCMPHPPKNLEWRKDLEAFKGSSLLM